MSRTVPVPAVYWSSTTSSDNRTSDIERRNQQHKLKHKQTDRTKGQTRRQSKLMAAGHRELALLTLVPQVTTLEYSSVACTSTFDRCGAFHVPNRMVDTSSVSRRPAIRTVRFSRNTRSIIYNINRKYICV